MDVAALRRSVIDANWQAFGVNATVTTAPGEDPIATRVIWPTVSTEGLPLGASLGRRDARLILAFKRADVASLPLGTKVVAPPATGGDPQGWIVEGIDRVEPEHVRAFVIADPDYLADEP